MNWLLSLLVALLSGVVGCVGAGFVSQLFVTWFRITSREGAAGFFVVGNALLGLIGGFIIGLICARVVAAGASPGFLKATGLGLGVTVGLLVLVLGFGWLKADFPPQIDGRELMLAVEVRFPPEIPLPDPKASDLYRWNVTITAMSAGRHQTSANLRLSESTLTDSGVVVPATVYLGTSDPMRSLGVGCGDHGAQFFDIPLPARPTRADMDWSPWLTEPHSLNRSPVPAEKSVAVRYRVQLEEEESP